MLIKLDDTEERGKAKLWNMSGCKEKSLKNIQFQTSHGGMGKTGVPRGKPYSILFNCVFRSPFRIVAGNLVSDLFSNSEHKLTANMLHAV